MQLTTKGRLAVTAMVDLALRSNSGPIALASISQRQKMSLSYLEQLFGKLRRSGLVESTRGPGGGYTMGRAADEITVADIILAVDDAEDGEGSARRSVASEGDGRCVTDELWAGLNQAMIKHLESISLAQLVKDQLDMGVSVETTPSRRAISSVPVVKPIKITAPNSVFALGTSMAP